MTGSSNHGIKTVLHPVSDLAAAKPVYTALLGVPPQHDASYYVGYEAGGQHIGLVQEAAHDGGWGRLVATVTDPDGNVLGLLEDK
jgi:hypothetical protein